MDIEVRAIKKHIISDTMHDQLDLFETEKRDKIDELLYLTGRYRNSREFYELMEFCARFRELSPYNAMLVQMQRPGSRYVLSASAWDKKYSARVKLNARPMIILVPFGPVEYVFDVDDLDNFDERLKLKLIHKPFKTKGEIPEKIYRSLVENLKLLGIELESVIYGSQQNAEIRYCRKYSTKVQELKDNKGKVTGYVTLPQYYQISVSSNNSMTENFASIVHELGHFFCQHLPSPGDKWWKQRNVEHPIEEFEAESIAWLICERLGIENPSEKYLARYINEFDNIPDVSIEMILKGVNQIEMLFKPVSFKKSLLAQKDDFVKKQISEK